MRTPPPGHQASSRGRNLRRWGVALLVLAATAATLYLARAPLLRALGCWWVVNESPVKSDAIVVLGGDSFDATRVRRAVSLYQQGYAPRILLAGGMIRWYLSEGALMKRDAESFGAPDGVLQVVESNADSTLDESEAILHYVSERNLHRLLLVTSDFHSRRAQIIYAPMFKKRGLEVRIISAPQFLLESPPWWENREALKAMFFEFLKLPDALWERYQRRDSTPGPQGNSRQVELGGG